MAVSGQSPTEVHLNSSTPAAPSGAAVVAFAAGSPYPDPNNPALSVRDVSASVPQAVPATGSPLSAPVPGVVLYDASGSKYKYLGADGNWYPVAKSNAGASHNFLTAYDETTGLFSKAQPAESDLSLTNITTNDVSTSKHGFCPILPNDATKYLDGTGAYSVPAGGGGGGGGGLTKISEVIVTTAVSTVSFGSIPSTYRNLIVEITARTSVSGSGTVDCYAQFNGDTATNYSRTYFFVNSGGTGQGGNYGVSQAPMLAALQASCPSGLAASATFKIFDYARTAWRKNATVQLCIPTALSGGNMQVTMYSFTWNSTAAINAILFGITSAGNFVTDSVFTLYGE